MSEKLLTLKETAECLRLSEQEVRDLVKDGKIPAYHVGGMYLRFKEEHVFSVRGRYGGKPPAPSNSKSKQPERSVSPFINIKDFFYFNDFYIFSAILIAVLIFVILRSIR